MATVTIGLREDDAFSWEKVADLLSIDMAKVQGLIAAGELKPADTFVTDRAFEEFCKRHSDEISIALIDPATAKWLIASMGFHHPPPIPARSPGSKACLSGQSLQVWKEDSRQPVLPAYQNLPIDESIACPTGDVIVDGPIGGFDGGIGAASIHGLVDVQIGIPSPFLKGWVRSRQFRAPSLAAVVREFHGPNGPRMAPHLSENSVKPAFRLASWKSGQQSKATAAGRLQQVFLTPPFELSVRPLGTQGNHVPTPVQLPQAVLIRSPGHVVPSRQELHNPYSA